MNPAEKKSKVAAGVAGVKNLSDMKASFAVQRQVPLGERVNVQQE
jgi:hypothetical protein